MTTYLTADSLEAFRMPDPLEEDYFVSELGGSLHIKGVTVKAERELIYAEIAELKASAEKGSLTGVLGYKPDADDVAAACWAAGCVAEPKLPAFQWLRFAAQGYMILQKIYTRCVVCSRMIEDPDNPKAIPDGVDAAKAGLEDNPLASSGGSSV